MLSTRPAFVFFRLPIECCGEFKQVRLEKFTPAVGRIDRPGQFLFEAAEAGPDPVGDTPSPLGLGLDTIPGFRMLMQENRDRAVFAKMTGKP